MRTQKRETLDVPSSMDAELLAINATLMCCLAQSGGQVYILIDSKADIHVLTWSYPNDYSFHTSEIIHLLMYLEREGKNILFQGIPARSGIAGNKMGDEVEKQYQECF